MRLTFSFHARFRDHAPCAVISLGLWPGETMIRLERVGINVADFEIADNEGLIVADRDVTGNGQAARLASLPLRAIETALLAAGIPARLSSTAGTFLCNACLYSFLEAVEAPNSCGAGPLFKLMYLPDLESVLDAET